LVAGQSLFDAQPSAEARLIQEAKGGSPSAWARIYDAHYQQLYRYCYARTSDQEAAADLASQVVLAALEGIDRFDDRGRPLLAWLYRIARNACVDYLRSRQRESLAIEQAATQQEQVEPSPAAAVDERRDLLAALRQLTEEQQQLIALRYYAGLSTSEIADAMERAPVAVYSLEARALASLRRLLEVSAEGALEAA